METKNRKSKMLAELGKYCIDLSKLVFGGIILAGVMQLDVNLKILLIIGAACVSGLASMCFYGIHLFFRWLVRGIYYRYRLWTCDNSQSKAV